MSHFTHPLVKIFCESSKCQGDFAKMGSHWISFDNYRNRLRNPKQGGNIPVMLAIYLCHMNIAVSCIMVVIKATSAYKVCYVAFYAPSDKYIPWVQCIWRGFCQNGFTLNFIRQISQSLEESLARWKHSRHSCDIYISYEHCGILHYVCH